MQDLITTGNSSYTIPPSILGVPDLTTGGKNLHTVQPRILEQHGGEGYSLTGSSTELFQVNSIFEIPNGLLRVITKLNIPGIALPEQLFTIQRVESKIVISNNPKDFWPRISFELSYVGKDNYVFENISLTPFDKTVKAGVLFTRCLLALMFSNCCTLPIYQDKYFEMAFHFENLSQDEWQSNFTLAKLFRKLEYIEHKLHVSFGEVPTNISSDEINKIDSVFFALIGEESRVHCPFLIFDINISELNLNDSPFTKVGDFVLSSSSPEIIFNKKLDMGGFKLTIPRSDLPDSSIITAIKRSKKSRIKLKILAVDHQYLIDFPKYDLKNRRIRNASKIEFEQYRAKVIKEETPRIFDLVKEPIVLVKKDDAVDIALGLLQMYQMPDKYCPQEPVLEEINGSAMWRVPIYLTLPGKEVLVGEFILDRKNGKVLNFTPIEQMRSKGKDIAKSILNGM